MESLGSLLGIGSLGIGILPLRPRRALRLEYSNQGPLREVALVEHSSYTRGILLMAASFRT